MNPLSKSSGRCSSLLVILLLLILSCNENTIDPVLSGTVQGTVKYAIDGLPVAGAEITTNPASSVTYTDAQGTFVIDNVPVGQVTVTVKLEGFKSENKQVNVLRNLASDVVFEISSSNSIPEAPEQPSPADESTGIGTEVTLKWYVLNKSKQELSFDVMLYEGTNQTALLKLTDYADTATVVKNLKFNTNYFWQVKVKNPTGEYANSPLWHFTTLGFPDNTYLFTQIEDGNFDIYSSNEAGTSKVRLNGSTLDQVHPVFSANRDRIAYITRTASGDQIFLMNNNGSGVRQVTTIPAASYHSMGRNFSWSPDQGKILYSHYDKLYTINTDGSNLTLIATAPAGRHFRSCDWTSVGNKIIVETIGILPYENELRLIDLNTATQTDVVTNLPGTIMNPSFSTDGKSILYTYDQSGYESADGRQLDSRIFLLNLTTNVLTDLSKEKIPGTNDLNPRFSATGASVVFENAPNNPGSPSSVWVVNVSDLKRKQLFSNAFMPDWK